MSTHQEDEENKNVVDNVVDVAIRDDEQSASVENAASSLPTVDEIKNNTDHHQGNEQRATCVWGCLGITLMIAIIGTLGGIIANQNDIIDSHSSTGAGKFDETIIFENGRHSDVNTVQDYLLENVVSAASDIYDETSYQYQAVNWLANVDEADLQVPTHLTIDDPEGYSYVFRYVMALNYFALNGPNWSGVKTFLSGKDVCEWNEANTNDEGLGFLPGVFCKSSIPDAVLFDNRNLQGHIPTENGLLTTLTQFRMSNNKLAGTIPTQLCQMTDMSHFSLQNNQLEGNIPDCFYNMEFKLNRLELGENALVGSIPNTFAKLQQLEYLDLSHNQLTGMPGATFSAMQKLKTLLAGTNRLGGYMDENFLRTLQTLSHLDLSFNEFKLRDGQFPAHFFNGLVGLEILNLSENELKGELPDVVVNMSKLKLLSLYNNRLSGFMHESLKNLQSLVHLDLSENDFDGDLPALSGMEQLKFLSLGGNPYLDEAQIPQSYAGLQNLEYLSIGNTNRVGPMPAYIAGMKELQYLDMSKNKFTGDFPVKYLEELSNVEVMLLNGNPQVGGTLGETITVRLDMALAVLMDGMNVTGDLNQLCPDNGELQMDMIFADCGGDEPAVLCDCCECCPPGNFGCSQEAVAELNEAIANAYSTKEIMFFNESSIDIFNDPSMVP